MRNVIYRLPFPPSLNRIWRAVSARVLLSAAARDWKVAAVRALPVGRVPPPLTGRLVVTLYLCPPARIASKPWDVANREKLLCDLLTEQRVWLDDSQIDVMLIVRGLPDDKGYVDILIQEY
jgi:crossover junction endodeoxyribonuclease RusA